MSASLKKHANGAQHPKATCTDAEVEMAVELVERYGLPAAEVARKFEVSRMTIWRWRNGRNRAPGAAR